ncbi:uncharacterized protein AB675_746 [Cyphellophora attinorum]|uniref:Uncharacterized protein n=1 Tax=Cyphellophora attinorum TaxID=1664694 RepID=A0A0N0NS21_9EURO|nr:uncharacterized protein AB675_746 [Phialophora attinorum]KPI45751.1 hypothetical protein AB675_746 [Phialophora attinorum]
MAGLLSNPSNATTLVLTPESTTPPLDGSNSIFLAGTTTTDWRRQLIRTLHENLHTSYGPLTIYDPILPNWSEKIPMESALDPAFRRQVEWEMSRAEDADLVVFMFGLDSSGGSKAGSGAVSLLELGLACERARSQHDQDVVVCCEKGFWKEGHVRMVCQRYDKDNVVLVETLQEVQEYVLRGGWHH